jgi:hypothetical protein
MSRDHDRRDHDDRGVDWFAILDVLVWGAVVIIAVLALEWVAGFVVRERLAAQAQRHMARVGGTSNAEG